MQDIGAEAQVFFGSSGPPLDVRSVVQATRNMLDLHTAGRVTHAQRLQGLASAAHEAANPATEYRDRYRELFSRFETILSSDREAIVAKAIFNQQLAQSLWRVQTDYRIAGGAEEFVTIIRAMDAAGIPLGIACNKVVSGARAQAGLMHVFDESGYHVVVPDPSKQNEVKEWDVEAGVDLVAFDEKNLVLYLIDAKSDSHERDEYDYRPYHYEFDKETNGRNADKYQKVAKQAMKKLEQSASRVQFCHVTITLHNDAMDNLGIIDNEVGTGLIHSLMNRLELG